MSSRLGIDVGGTFTDLLLFDERSGAMRLLKTPSTPSDQSVGILNGIQQLIEETGVAASDIATLLHGTTVSTNIVLEEKGAKVGLLVTENFEQVLHLARSQTPGPSGRLDHHAEAGSAGGSRTDPRYSRAHQCARRRHHAARRSVGPQGGARTGRAGRRSHHGFVDAFIREPAARAADQSHHRGNCAGNDGITVFGNPAGIPRVRAHAGHRHERLCASKHAALPERLRGKTPSGSVPIERQHRALRRRPDERRARQPIAGAHHAIRPRRRRVRCGVHGVARRVPASPRLRYGRHLDRRVLDRGR